MAFSPKDSNVFILFMFKIKNKENELIYNDLHKTNIDQK